MWLINAKTYLLERFIDERNAPPYAILSHTWGENELEFKDLQAPDGAERARSDVKVRYTCEETLTRPLKTQGHAQTANLEYAWIDTICIDKSSSAELSEAINSMFQYYKKAHVCFAFLTDVDLGIAEEWNGIEPDDGFNRSTGTEGPDPSESNESSKRDAEKVRRTAVERPWLHQFMESRWHTRGWTLQELLAPSHLVFYDRNWKALGSRLSLAKQLWQATNIDLNLLGKPGKSLVRRLKNCSVAKRMSWVARRQTTRVEDLAYCLLGIFNVNMPLLYGEGRKAFQRLQEAIIRKSPDITILAWNSTELFTKILAHHPRCFAECGDSFSWLKDQTSFEITQTGLQGNFVFYQHHLLLPCWPRTDPAYLFAISLEPLACDGDVVDGSTAYRFSPWCHSEPIAGVKTFERDDSRLKLVCLSQSHHFHIKKALIKTHFKRHFSADELRLFLKIQCNEQWGTKLQFVNGSFMDGAIADMDQPIWTPALHDPWTAFVGRRSPEMMVLGVRAQGEVFCLVVDTDNFGMDDAEFKWNKAAGIAEIAVPPALDIELPLEPGRFRPRSWTIHLKGRLTIQIKFQLETELLPLVAIYLDLLVDDAESEGSSESV